VEPNIDVNNWNLIGGICGSRVLYIDLKTPGKKSTGKALKECVIVNTNDKT